MIRATDKQLFDTWATHYDAGMDADEAEAFPFAGYEQVLDETVRLAGLKPGMQVLDLGIGTGNLAQRLLARGCVVWGMDFSAAMLAEARQKLPQVQLFEADLLGAWPPALHRPFDRIVSAYVLHHFDLPTKIALLQRLATHSLAADGVIVIGDIAFPTTRPAQPDWDEDEHYWFTDEALHACERAGLRATYQQVSRCGGVFTFTKK